MEVNHDGNVNFEQLSASTWLVLVALAGDQKEALMSLVSKKELFSEHNKTSASA